MNMNITGSTFDVINFWWKDFNINKPSSDEHLFPLELLKGKEFYELKITHKYEMWQNNISVLKMECFANYKTDIKSNNPFDKFWLLALIKSTIEISRSQLQVITNKRGGISVTYNIPADKELLEKINQLLASLN